MVSSLLGGLPLQVDAIPNENRYPLHGNYNPTLSLAGTDSFWMAEDGSNTLGTFGQQNFNTVTQAGNYNTSIPTQLENLENCGGVNMVDVLGYEDEEVTRH
ncbi:hypothetical protein ACHAQD_002474 [Fusarium lateritium]